MARAEQAYVLGALLVVFGTLIQDVVADAMSTEVVDADRREPEMRGPSTTFVPSSAWCRCSAVSRCRSESSPSPACRAGSRAFSAARPSS